MTKSREVHALVGREHAMNVAKTLGALTRLPPETLAQCRIVQQTRELHR
jgi:hypothetical protein